MTIPIENALDVLCVIYRHTKADPVTAEAIGMATGVDARTIAFVFEVATRRGFALCSGGRGYYRAETREEWEDHLEKERLRAMALLTKVSDARTNYVGQFTLFEIREAQDVRQ